MSSDRIMTTRELATYMKLNEKTIIKMAQKREIPGIKVGNQWRFHLSAIDNYMQRDILSTPDNDLDTLINTADHIIPLSRLVTPELIAVNCDITDMDMCLRKLAEIAENAGITDNADLLYSELAKREEMLSTAVGNNIALPHPRNPNPALFKQPNIIIMTSRIPVKFSSSGKKKASLFFMPAASNVISHLRLLARISKLVHSKEIVNDILSAKTSRDVFTLLLKLERDGFFPKKD